jgi:hypothetical protein
VQFASVDSRGDLTVVTTTALTVITFGNAGLGEMQSDYIDAPLSRCRLLSGHDIMPSNASNCIPGDKSSFFRYFLLQVRAIFIVLFDMIKPRRVFVG